MGGVDGHAHICTGVRIFIFVFVFVFMRDTGADADADGRDSRTRPAWLSGHSHGGMGVEGPHVTFVGRRPYTLVIFFHRGVRLCASGIFMIFEVLVV